MLERLKTYWYYGSIFCGVEYTTTQNKDRFYITFLKKKKNVIDIRRSVKVKSEQALFENLPKKQHVTIVLNNNQVITKCIKHDTSDEIKNVYKAFPNLNIDDFYYQLIPFKELCYVSICRKEYVQGIIKMYTDQGLFVLNILLGNASVLSFSDTITNKELYTTNGIINLESGEINPVEKLKQEERFTQNFNGLTVSNQYLLSVIAGLSSLIKPLDVTTNIDKQRQLLVKTYKSFRFVKQGSLIGLVFLFICLFINVLLFNSYSQKVGILKETTKLNLQSKETVVNLKQEVTKMEKTVIDILNNSSSKSSYFLNEIVSSKPNTVSFSDFNYQPISSRIKKDKPIRSNRDLIELSGRSTDKQEFSIWLLQLESMSWISQITIIELTDISSQKSDFKLKIVLTDE